jgi:hypothetical protein
LQFRVERSWGTLSDFAIEDISMNPEWIDFNILQKHLQEHNNLNQGVDIVEDNAGKTNLWF